MCSEIGVLLRLYEKTTGSLCIACAGDAGWLAKPGVEYFSADVVGSGNGKDI